MRIFAVSSIAITLAIFQVGCASTPAAMAKKSPSSKMPTSKTASAPEYLAASQLEKQGKLKQARGMYQKLMDKNPKNPEYMHRMAVVCTRLKRYDEAEKLYKNARKLDPKNSALLADFGYFYYVKDDLSQAEKLLRESLRLRPNYARATFNLALVVGVNGDLDEALSLLKQTGSEAEALAGLAYIYEQRGEPTLAEARYRDALAIDPQRKDATRALAKLTKNKPRKENLIAKSLPDETKSESPIDQDEIESTPPTVPAARNRKSAVQLAGSIADESSQEIVTANFVDDKIASLEPSLLKANHETNDEFEESKDEFAEPPTKQRDSDDAEFDDTEWDESPKAPAALPAAASNPSTELDTEDDWAKN